ncbi:hypothetical protein OPT61_g8552 [Boeremia exigua]|uniref:Uncharacterized protein n=1 Tax=Boeremia exigua TaxID=749465 RepID=A0ACC2HYF3_9PLEO|nr:hypothetical protein OPT61_g8552 [Boeremia exigua]
MPSDEQFRTARAIIYRRLSNKPAVVSYSGPEQLSYSIPGAMQPPRRPRPRPPSAKFHRSSRTESQDAGFAVIYAAYLQHERSTDLAQRIRKWERECSPQVDTHPFADEEQPWRASSPRWAPARLPGRPEVPQALTPNLPAASSPSYFEDFSFAPLFKEPQWLAGSDTRSLKDGSQYTTCGSPPLALAGAMTRQSIVHEKKEVYLHQREDTDHNLNEKRGAEQKHSEKENLQCEKTSNAEETQDPIPDWLRALVKLKQRCHFKKNFNFGPRTRQTEENEYLNPLSPHSSCISLPDLHSQIQNKSLKRQRHGSSTVKAVLASPRDRLHLKPSPVRTERSRSNPPAQEFASPIPAMKPPTIEKPETTPAITAPPSKAI